MSYLAVLVAAVLCYAALGAVLRALPELVDDRALLGLLVGAPALTAVVTRPAGGRWADRLGAPPVMLSGAVLMAAGIVPALIWDTTGVLLASRLAVGAAEGVMMSAAVLWLLRLAGPERRGVALGHIGLANYAGLTAGPLLASALGLERTPVLVAAAVLPLLGALVAVFARRPARERPVDEAHSGVWRATLIPGIGLMFVNVGYVALLAFGGQAGGSGLIVPVFAAGVIVVRTVGATIPDRAGPRRTAPVAALLGAVGLLLVAHGPALVGTALLAVGQGLAVPSFGLLALARVPAARHGAAAGLFFAFFDAGVGIGGPLSGAVARAASPAAALTVAAGVFAASGALAARATMAR